MNKTKTMTVRYQWDDSHYVDGSDIVETDDRDRALSCARNYSTEITVKFYDVNDVCFYQTTMTCNEFRAFCAAQDAGLEAA